MGQNWRIFRLVTKSSPDKVSPDKVILTLRKLKTVLSSLKVPVDKSSESRVVYKWLCSRCQACYVGQTDQHLLKRFKQHCQPPNRSGNLSDYVEHPSWSIARRMLASFTLLPGVSSAWMLSLLHGYGRYAQPSIQKTSRGVEDSPSSRILIFLVARNFQSSVPKKLSLNFNGNQHFVYIIALLVLYTLSHLQCKFLVLIHP